MLKSLTTTAVSLIAVAFLATSGSASAQEPNYEFADNLMEKTLEKAETITVKPVEKKAPVSVSAEAHQNDRKFVRAFFIESTDLSRAPKIQLEK